MGSNPTLSAKIPIDLLAHYGKKEIKVSLKTTDKREAIRLCNLKSVAWDEEIERIHGQRAIAMGKRAPQKTARFDEDTIAKVANFWVNQALEADVELWLEGLDGREIGEMSSTLTENGVLLRAALSKGDVKPIEPVMHTVLHFFGIEAEDRDEAGLGEEIHDALTGHAEGGGRRQYGASFYPMAPLIKAINKIQCKKVSIPVALPIR